MLIRTYLELVHFSTYFFDFCSQLFSPSTAYKVYPMKLPFSSVEINFNAKAPSKKLYSNFSHTPQNTL